MKYYAVIATNVLLSALLAKNEDSATVKVLDAVLKEKFNRWLSCISSTGKPPALASTDAAMMP